MGVRRVPRPVESKVTPSEEFPLHDYQRMGVSWLQSRPSSILVMEAGHGKTRCVLEALTPEHLPALVVGPPKVAATVWDAERDRWRVDLPVAKATGNPDQRLSAFRSDEANEGLTTISWESLPDAIAKRGRPKWKTLVFDELSMARNHTSRRFKSGKQFTEYRDLENVWGLTATPAPNSLMDLWAQARLVDGGAHLGVSFPAFRNRYFRPDGTTWIGGREVVTSWSMRAGSEEQIWKLVEPLMLSIFGQLKLPPRHDNVIRFSLPEKVRKIYNEMHRELAADLDELGLGDGAFSTPNAASLSSRLSQISSGFMYPDPTETGDPEWFDTSRRDACFDVLESATSPVLVFYRFREEARVILERFKDARMVDRDGEILHAWNRGEVPILLAHPAAMSHGVNAQRGGSAILWSQPPWSTEHWTQGNARLLRQGQLNPVVIHVVCADGTIDTQKVLPRLEGKLAVEQRFMDAIGSPI